ncbi:GlxA family transcriptional regulator [Actinomadura sp. ATCC 39365]
MTVPAAAGLLDNRRATTYRYEAGRPAAPFPHVRVDPAPIFVRDGTVATSGGVTAALDLTLSFIEEDHGAELADQVLVRRVVDHVVSHLDEDLGVARLAAPVGVSERHLSRLFVECVGRSPSRLVCETRLEAAAQLLTGTREPVAAIARRCGFSSAESLRQAFVVWAGVSPSRFHRRS